PGSAEGHIAGEGSGRTWTEAHGHPLALASGKGVGTSGNDEEWGARGCGPADNAAAGVLHGEGQILRASNTHTAEGSRARGDVDRRRRHRHRGRPEERRVIGQALRIEAELRAGARTQLNTDHGGDLRGREGFIGRNGESAAAEIHVPVATDEQGAEASTAEENRKR